MQSIADSLTRILRGTVQVSPEVDLVKKLNSGKRLKIKLGMDPTSPDLHLGHAVVLSKMKDFQELGHEIIFLIGDYTARIGDPTGRSKTRPPLTEEEILFNTRTYFTQVARILDPEKTTVRYNSEWLSPLTCKELLELSSKITLARLIERDDFARRIEQHQAIRFHELFYPLFQAYDSVALEADVELGGTDQTFNLLMGRFLQEQSDQNPQVIITMPLLEGTDGKEKMSKSLGNAIGLTENADNVYGKIMSISDVLMWRYFRILLDTTQQELSSWQESVAAGKIHPMELKKNLAHTLVKRFWSLDEANIAETQFRALFQKKDYSHAQTFTMPQETENSLWIIDFLKLLGAIKTSSDGKRLLQSGAITIDGTIINDFKQTITWKSGMIVKVGKHKIYQIA